MDPVDIINENDEVVGVSTRHEAHKNNLLHRSVSLFVERIDGSVLFQTRTDNGLMDPSAAGHVDAGETYGPAIVREAKEEIGIDVVHLEFLGGGIGITDTNNTLRTHKFQVYTTIGEPGEIDRTDVAEVFWLDPYTIFNNIRNGIIKEYSNCLRDTLPFFIHHIEKRKP